MGNTAQRLTAGMCGIVVIAGTMTVTMPAANASVNVTQSVDNVVKDSNQQQVIDVFNGINAFRATKGLQPVKFSVPISKISQGWSDRMAATDTFYHNPDYVTGSPTGWRGASEIIAARWDRSGQGLVDQWIMSPGHNAIMSDPQYNTMGIGVAFTDLTQPADSNATRYGTYGTANLFRYDRIPVGTFNTPADYFAGKPPITETTDMVDVVPRPPDFDVTNRTYTIHDIVGVQYKVNGVIVPPDTYSVSPTSDVTITVQAVPETGYRIPATVQSTWGKIFAKVGPTVVTPATPRFNPTAMTYTIPSQAGVEYSVNGTVKPAGTYPGAGITSVKATATAGYALTGTTTWSYTFAVPATVVTPLAPTFNSVARTYTIPAQPGVEYSVNNVVKPAGTYPGFGAVTVTAKAASGYILSGTASWNTTFPAAVIAVTPAAPTFSQTGYTIPSKVGVDYFVNGAIKPAGTYSGVGLIAITARAKTGYSILGTSSWTGTIPAPIVSVTPTAPTFSTTGKTFTIPAKTGVDYSVNGVVKAAGTYTGLGFISIKATAKAGYVLTGTTTWTYTYEIPVLNVYAIKAGDLVAVDSKGALWNYGNSTSKTRRAIASTGWASTKQIFVTDWNADGIQDVVAKTGTGSVTVSYGTRTGTLMAPKVIGSGWGTYEISVGKYAKLDKYPTIIAKDSVGNLWQYSNPTGAGIGPRVKKGSGWGSLQISLLDWDKDGNMDIIAKTSAGEMRLYRTDGTGKFKAETRKVIGAGWGGFQVSYVSGYAGAGSQGILAKDKSGNLYYYGTAKGVWVARTLIGGGWTPMIIASS